MAKQKSKDLNLSKEQLLDLYRKMLLIRYCEEQLVKSYARGDIPGGMHTYIGEEAVATGVCAHLTFEDAVFSTHRGHGHALAKGMKPERMIAEVMGKASGCCGGRGGSMHLFEPSVGLFGTSGIVGPCILLATGAGYKAKLQGTDRVGVAFFGDGVQRHHPGARACQLHAAGGDAEPDGGIPRLRLCGTVRRGDRGDDALDR